MNLDLLKTLIVVAKYRSISKASDELYRTPPAITKQIKNLEEEYGIQIFEKRAKKRILTEDGKLLLDYAKRFLDLANESKEAFSEDHGPVTGTLKISTIFAVGVYILPKLMGTFSEKYPGLEISIELDNSENILRAVKRYDANFGFIGKKLDDPLISLHLFYKDKIHLVTGQSHPIKKNKMTWKEVEGLKLIRRERGSDIRDATDLWLKERNISLMAKMELNNTEAIKECLKYGIGFSLLPQSTIEDDVELGLLRVISVPYLNLVQTYYVCHYRDKSFSKPEKVFLEFLFQALESGSTFISSAPFADQDNVQAGPS